MTYTEALKYIASLEPRGWRLGLDRMREFAHRAGLDDSLGTTEKPKYIHIAGTNGKGSTTAYVQSILHESGYRTGAFFSPYVYNPRERIQLGRELIPEAIFAGLASMLEPLAEEFTETEFGGISEFEFKAAMAFMFYKRLECEWVALEVGLGGRLDATNIVTPRCSVIVSIGLDHTSILGDSLEQIAHEKAGVIKPGVPVVIGQMPAEARQVIEREAAEQGCATWRFGQEVTVAQDTLDGSVVVITPRGQHAGINLGIKGAMQGHNMALAVAACDAANATRTLRGLQRGTARATIPARFEIRRIPGPTADHTNTMILDGAHNGDAAQVLVESLRTFLEFGKLPGGNTPAEKSQRRGRVLLLTGMVAGHDPASFYRWFEGAVDKAFIVPIHYHRALPPDEIAPTIERYMPVAEVFESVQAGLEKVLQEATEDDTILVTGSFYLVGEVGSELARTLDKRLS